MPFWISFCWYHSRALRIIAWKASSLTLLGTVGSLILEVIENFVRAQPMSINPFVHLEVIAIIYFIFLLYYRKRYGG